jgi:uncharacterized membrane protein YoaK (UPF0700 family)
LYKNTDGRFTLREHVRRHTYLSPFWDWMLNFLMGRSIDQHTTQWDEMFLPSETGKNLSGFYYKDDGGNNVKLTGDAIVMNAARGRKPVLAKPPALISNMLLPAIILAAIACVIYAMQRRGKMRALFYLYQALFSLFFAASGTALFFMTFFTDHDYTWHNINIIFANPLLFAAAVFAFIAGFSKKEAARKKAEKALRWFFCYVFAAALVSLIAKLIPQLRQDNYATLALVMPTAFVCGVLPLLRKLHIASNRS